MPSSSLYAELLESHGAGRSLSRPRAAGRYFPKRLRKAFPDALEQHRLRREIIATQLANSMINRGGPSLVVRIADQTGATLGGDRPRLRGGAQQLRHAGAQRRDQRARQQGRRASVQLELYAAVQDLLLDRLVWFLRNVDLTQGPGERRRALSRGHRGGGCCARHRAAAGCDAAARRARDEELEDGRRARRAGAPHRRACRNSPQRPTWC